MADRLEWFDVTIPAGTLKTALFTSPMVFMDGDVVEIDVKILDGPCGTVGFWIGAGGSQYVPRTVGSFIIPNDDYFTWPLANAINSGSWQLTGYNLDSFPHLIQVAFQVNETGTSPALSVGTVGVSSAGADAALSLASASTSSTPDPLSPDALLNSTPAGSNVTSPTFGPDLTGLTGVADNGTP
jgi:hypothetical protein